MSYWRYIQVVHPVWDVVRHVHAAGCTDHRPRRSQSVLVEWKPASTDLADAMLLRKEVGERSMRFRVFCKYEHLISKESQFTRF